MSLTFARPLAVIVLTLTLAACAPSAPAPTSISSPASGASAGRPSPSPLALPSDPNTLLLAVRTAGGPQTADAAFSQINGLRLYADGRLLSSSGLQSRYPGPLLDPLSLNQLSTEQVRTLLGEAAGAGLTSGRDQQYLAKNQPTMPSTVIAVWSAAGLTTTSFAGLGVGGLAANPAETQARNRAQIFLSTITSLISAKGSAPSSLYAPSEVRLLVRPNRAAAAPGPSGSASLAWPLDTPLSDFGTLYPAGGPGTRCGAVSGTDLTLLWPLLEKANQLTAWTSGDQSYQLVARELLPDEQGGCLAN